MLLCEPLDGAEKCFVRGAFSVTARSVTWPDIWPADAFFPSVACDSPPAGSLPLHASSLRPLST
jgi:hypothetical protein